MLNRASKFYQASKKTNFIEYSKLQVRKNVILNLNPELFKNSNVKFSN